jgi:putative flavoprotein involved in K+ transport
MRDQELGTVVIGGSQSGLAVGYHLRQQGLPFVILDDNDRIGDAWRKRWDSLHLFTPGRYSNLPGMPFPGPPSSYPGKDEIADYLEAYAHAFELPVRTGVKVDRLSKVGDRFEVNCGKDPLFAENAVVATGASSNPRIPEFARELDERIVQIHSKAYRNPSQIAEGAVLVVGAGNTGQEPTGGGRESSRSTAHTFHVAHGDAGVDGEPISSAEGSATTFSTRLAGSLWAASDARTSPLRASSECRE